MKRIILTAALCLSLSGAVYAAPDNAQDQAEQTCCTTVDVTPQTAIDVDSTPSEEVNYIEESPIAKRMTQAEKAHNAEVNDSWGGAITLIAMSIVIAALVILSLLFTCFGKISEALLSKNKSKAKSEAQKVAAATTDDSAHHDVDSGEVIAAIGMALAEHFGERHDMEDTILTIRRMKRAYSPWNSKIYNIRQVPELHKGPHDTSAL